VSNSKIGTQQQRIEKLFAELPVPGPDFAIPVLPEREHIDEHRIGSIELHVIRGGIRQAYPCPQRLDLNIKMQQGRRLEQRERPFIGVGHKWNARMAQNHRGQDASLLQCRILDFLRGNKLALAHKLRRKAGIAHVIEFGHRLVQDRAVNLAVEVVNAPARITERSGIHQGMAH